MPSGDKKGKNVPLYQIKACLADEGIFEGREGNEGTTWISGEGGKSAADRGRASAKALR